MKAKNRRAKRSQKPSMLTHRVPARLSAPRVRIDTGLAWYALWTVSRQERKAEQRLREMGFATYLPSMAHARVRRSAVFPIERLAVGRYLFVGLPADDTPFGTVAALDEVQSFVSACGMPLRLAPESVQAFSDHLSSYEITLRGHAVSQLMVLMQITDDARARERGPFWTQEEAA